jgi:tetratricopeptide (TPR) repeat protein
VGLALAYNKLGRFDRSVEALQRASTLAPKEPEIAGALGVAYFLSGKLDPSIETLESLSSSDPKETSQPVNLVSLYYLGRAYEEKGEFGKALPALLKVQREVPAFTDALLHFKTALQWLDKGSPEAMEAQREIKELAEPGSKGR